MSVHHEILLAEDDEIDVILVRRAFKDAGTEHVLRIVRNGQEAIDFLAARDHVPDDRMPAIIILDLKMPRRDGLEVLEWIRSRSSLRCLPVFIFSSSAHQEDVERAYALGANGYLVKPSSVTERAKIAAFFNDWLKFNQFPLAVTEGLRVAHAFQATRTPKPAAPP